MKLILGYSVLAVLMVLLPLAAEYLTNPDSTGYYTCLVILLVLGITGGFLQSTVFGMAGMLPPSYMGAVMFGNGISGITCNLINCITLVAFPDDQFLGSLIYFILAAIMLVLCVISMIIL